MMERRTFLTRLGFAAVYSVVPVATRDNPEPERIDPTSLPAAPVPRMGGPSRYVVKNEGSVPMIVHYQKSLPPEELARQKKYGLHHASAILLPLEELTITAVPMNV